MRRKRIGVIGCGLRACGYLNHLKPGLGREWELAALADPSPLSLDIYQKHWGHAGTRRFASGPELLEALGGDLDGVIIASPNRCHLESLMPAIKRGLTILVEKPVVITLEDCAAAWNGYETSGRPPLTVGFSLRCTPFYRTIKQLVERGDIGQLLSIEATEMMGAPLTTFFTRHWRRRTELAGPLILEKCCHDMDLLRWIAGAAPVRVSSFETRTRFVPNPDAALQCSECKLEPECRYSSYKVAPYWVSRDQASAVAPLLPRTEDGLCVFNSDKDVPDHQVANIEFANGVLAAFTVCMDQPRTTRTIRVFGTAGQLYGDLDLDELWLTRTLPGQFRNEARERISIVHDGSGHSGGDSILSAQFQAMLRGETGTGTIGLREGLDACILSLAIDRASREGRVVTLPDLEDAVYRKNVQP